MKELILLMAGCFLIIAGIVFFILSRPLFKSLNKLKDLTINDEERDEISKSIEASVRDLGECYKNEIERLSESSKVPLPA